MSNPFHEAADKYEDLTDDLEDATASEVSGVVYDTAQQAVQEVQTSHIGASGQLETLLRGQSYDATVVDDSSNADYKEQLELPGVYAYVEFGTGLRGDDNTLRNTEWGDTEYDSPDTLPPYGRILDWIVDKGISPREYTTVFGLALAIQQAIRDFGTEASPFLRPAWYKYRDTLDDRLADSYNRILDDYAS